MESRNIAVAGVEVTQATQFYGSDRHLDSANAEPDLSIPLVTGKPLAVRVYVDANSDDSAGAWVDGELWFRGRQDLQWRPAERFPGQVPAQPARRIDRGNAQHTLNFRIPADACYRDLAIRTRVRCDRQRSIVHSEWRVEHLEFVDVPPLKLRIYGVRLDHPNLDIEPPSAAETLHALSFVRKTFPIPSIDVLSYETISFSGNLAASSESVVRRAWSKLLVLLTRLQTANLSSVIHFAMLPNLDSSQSYLGLGSARGVGASFVGNGPATAQEIGHALQLSHAPGGGASRPDAHYPAYGSYPPGSIGEYGFDAVTGHVHSPKICCDLMGYGDHHWVSPYTYRLIMDRLRQQPHVARDHVGEPGREHVHVRARLDTNQLFRLESALALPGPTMRTSDVDSGHHIELRDSEDGLLSVHSVKAPIGSRANESRFVQSIPLDEGAATLVIRGCDKRDDIRHTIHNQEGELRLELKSLPKSGKLCSGIVAPRWELNSTWRGRLIILVRYSCDGGLTWRGLNPGLNWNDCQINLDVLPGGKDCRLQVIAWSALGTSIAQSPSFHVARKRRQASIETEITVGAGRPAVELFGAAHCPEGFAADEDLEWRSSAQGILGRGGHLTCYDMPKGEHIISLHSPDGLDGQAVAQAKLLVP